MHNRDNIRWAPFNSVINGNDVIKEIREEKSHFKKPILSEEQIADLEERIIISYNEQSEIDIIHYRQGKAYKLHGKVTKLDSNTKKITINYKNDIFFGNILKII